MWYLERRESPTVAPEHDDRVPLTPEIDPYRKVDPGSSVVLPLRLHAVPPWLSINLARVYARSSGSSPNPSPSGHPRQRPDLPEPSLPRRVSGLAPAQGIHHAVHAGAERGGRTLLPQPEGRVRLAAQLPELHRGPPRGAAVDPLVQRGASPSGARLPQPARI